MVLSIFTKLYIYCHYLIPELFHPPQKELHTPQKSRSISPSSSPRQPLIYFLSLWNCLGNIFALQINQRMAKCVSQSKLI